MTFCSDPLFDLALATDAARPDLTQCFHLTIPLYLPCLFLWAFFPYYLRLASELKKSWDETKPKVQQKPQLKIFTPLFVIKVVLVLVAALTVIVGLSVASSKEEWQPLVVYVTPIILLVTLAYELLALYLHQRLSHYTSAIQFYFWGSLVLLQLPTVASSSRTINENVSDTSAAIIQLIFWVACLLSFLAHCFADVPSGEAAKVN